MPWPITLVVRLAITIPTTRLFAALGLGAAFLFVIAATVVASGMTSGDAPAEEAALEDLVDDPSLRVGEEFTRLGLPVYAPSPPTPPPAPPPASAASPFAFIWPADFPLVQGMWAGHPLGADIGTWSGVPVLAVRDGRIAFAGGDPCCSYGLFVIVEHDEGWASLYAHLDKIDVKVGDEVKQGQPIGISGGTGHVTGPHLHFELRKDGGLVNPLDYLEPKREWSVTAELLAERANGQPTEAPSPTGDAGTVAVAGEPVAPPASTAPPTPDNSLNAGTAISLGASWLARQDQSAYSIDTGLCTAAQSGPNWWVTCEGQLQGCSGRACMAQLTACVFDQPRLVAGACP